MTAVQTSAFASAAQAYHRAGWPAVLPVPPVTKTPPPSGYSGAEGQDTPAALLSAWAADPRYAQYSVALRMPDGVIGIDVDEYDKVSRDPVTGEPRTVHKRGAATLAAAVARWGALPPTWTSTARGEGPSRIAFFRVPPGRYATAIQPDIEIIQRHHRYAVVGPSPHETGGIYQWYGPDGRPAERIPGPWELPELPAAWVAGLREGAAAASPASASHASGEALLAALALDERGACSEMFDALEAAVRALTDPDVGTRHDAMTARIHRVVQTAAMGHPGLGLALPGLRAQWEQLTAGEDRSAEFERMLLSSARKAVTALGGVQQLADPCEMFGGATWAGVSGVQVDARPRPVDDRTASEDGGSTEPLTSGLPPKLVDPWWRQVIGAEAFTEGHDLDHPMGDAMLRRAWPMVRRASDTTSAWLLRGAEQWTVEGDLSGRIVSECVDLMPEGDPEPVLKGEKPTPAQRDYKRRVRLMGNGAQASVAGTIKRRTDGGRHLATVRLVDLDREPDVLWAGGRPWDLRASGEVPRVADFVDLHGPHLVAAGVLPAVVPTPYWDAFVAAVWPDGEVRAWALRVLSIAFTGYPDAALPILYGAGGTGKTSLIMLLMEVLGSYAHAANPKLLSEADQFMTYQLKGRRLSFIDEAMREGQRNAETLKQLTGGGSLTGAAKYQNEITFAPTHTLVLTSNTPPAVSDAAIRRRVRLLPCEGDPEEVRARRQALTPRVWAREAPGVLALMMREAAGWLDAPGTALTSAAPLAVQFLLSELVSAQDVIAQWLSEAVTPNDQGTRSHRLFVGFRGWCRDAGIREGAIPNETVWGRALTDLGFGVIKRRDANYRGLIVRPDPGYVVMPEPSTPPGASLHKPSTPSGANPPTGAANPPTGAANPPTGAANLPGVEGLWRGVEGGIPQPSTPYNPWSPYVSSPSVEGVEGSPTPLTYGASENTIYREWLPTDPPPSTQGVAEGASSQVNHCLEPVEGTSARPSTPPQGLPDDVEKGASSQVTRRFGPVTEAQAAKAALKAAERAAKREAVRLAAVQAREAARLAAVREAGGALHPLPTVVDRSGGVIPVTPDEAAAEVRACLARSGALTVDVETSGYPVGHELHELRSVQLGDATAAVVLDPVAHAELIRGLLAEAPALVAFSATADLVPLTHAGLIDPAQAWDRMHDVVIPAKLADPTKTGADADGLKKTAGAVLGATATAPTADAARAALFKAGKWSKRTGWAQVETGCATMLRYAASDVLDTALLAIALPQPDPAVYARERLAQRMTARVTHRGLQIDGGRVAELTDRHTAAKAAAAERVRAFGVDNPGSNPQVAAKASELGATLPRTKRGAPSVAEGALDPLRTAEGPLGAFASAVLDYRHHDTVLGTFLGPFRELCAHGDGRARPTIYTLGTDTGRMSCVRPNLQQLPREGGVRACITADPEHVLISADFSGVEIRVAAALSGDETLRQLLAEGRDLHAEIALQVFGPDPEATAKAGVPTASKAHRYVAKRIVFGRLYGGGLETLARQGGCDLATAQRAVDTLDRLTPGLSEWSATTRDHVRQGHTQFPTYAGRVIHLPPTFPHKAPNYCVGMNTPVLRSDLTHVAASKIQVGDRLVGFDEHPQDGTGGQNKYHHMRTAVVEAVSTVVKPSVKVHTADGKVTECSTDHLWLVRPLKGRKNNRPRVRWVRADALQPGDDLLSLGTWDVADGRTAGYLAGLFDGEGYLSRHAGGRRKNQLFFSQLDGPVMDAMRAGMDELDLPHSYYDRAPNSTSPTDSVAVSGLRNVLRTLGTLQPARFRPRFEEVYEGNAITAGLTESVPVTAIEPAGELELASIQTSTRTLVANGYLSHNCIQGTARELLVDALIRWQGTAWGDATLLPVHDELVAMVPAQGADAATAELVRCMTSELAGVAITAAASDPTFAWADSV